MCAHFAAAWKYRYHELQETHRAVEHELTESTRRYARQIGLGVMVGNMVGSSLAMAPAFVVGQLCDIVDLDGPTFLAKDRQPSIVYERGTVWSGADVWGSAHARAA